MSQALLQTKLYRPPLRQELVQRPRLVHKLNAGLGSGAAGFAGRVSLISAPPGFGKTTVALAWLDQLSAHYRSAWLSLEPADDDPPRFLAYLLGAIQTVQPGIGRELLSAPQPPPLSAAAEMLARELADLVEPLILALDDYHVITSKAINQAIAFLIDHLPANVHLALISRADPPFSLSRLRIRRQLTEVRARDLRFTFDEAADFLSQTMGLNLAPADVAMLESRTEGWVAGLQLAAHSLQSEPDTSHFLKAFAGDDRYIADYLMEEVLSHQPEAVQQFLVRTSILGRLAAGLCDAVLERQDSQATLASLEQSNLFVVPLDNRRHWYRYHHLFAELLQERLEASDADLSQLHRRASRWYAGERLVPQAIDHALLATDFETAIQLILENVFTFFQEGQLSTLLDWWQTLPTERTRQDPRLSMMAAWAWLATDHPTESEQCLQDIEQVLGRTTSSLLTDLGALEPDVRSGLIEVAAVRMSRRSSIGRNAEDTLALCRTILPYLVPEEQAHLYSPLFVVRPVVLFNMGLAHQERGELDLAVTALEEAVELGKKLQNAHIVAGALGHLAEVQMVQGHLHAAAGTCRQGIVLLKSLAGKISPLSGLLHVRLGQIEYEWNHLEAAADAFEEGVRVARPWRNREALLPGYLGLARCYRALGRTQESQEAVEAFTKLLSPDPAFSLVAAEHARLEAERGQTGAARRWLEASSPDLMTDPRRGAEAIITAQIWALVGDIQEAAVRSERLLPAAKAGARWGHVVQLTVLRAVCLESAGAGRQALEALEQALELAEEQSYTRTFIDAGPAVARLLRERVATGDASAYADRLLEAFAQDKRVGAETDRPASRPDAAPASHDDGPVEALSDRERDVLRLIAEGLTNKEIAARLYLAVGTVKVHAHNIYGKLGVNGRTQAVAEARRRNLLP